MERIPFSDGTGFVIRHADFPSKRVGLAARHIDVWLPPDYDADPERRFPVLYMQDGQNLFDPALAYGGVDWGIDETVKRLMEKGRIPGVIVVGIWNSPDRRRDYMPQQPLESPRVRLLRANFIRDYGGPPLSEAYLRYMVEEVKPMIDSAYRTRPDQPHTFVMGSSMGGLISLYALTRYPNVFRGAGCVSTHWPIGGRIMVDYFGANIPRAGQHLIYFDFGTATLDAEYEPFQIMMDAHMEKAGYTRDKHWQTLKFEGAEHSERSWRERVDIPLEFLLSGR